MVDGEPVDIYFVELHKLPAAGITDLSKRQVINIWRFLKPLKPNLLIYKEQ